MKFHLLLEGHNDTACGLPPEWHQFLGVTDGDSVNCGNCIRTKEYREWFRVKEEEE